MSVSTVVYLSIAILGGILVVVGLFRFIRAHFELPHRMAAEGTSRIDPNPPATPLGRRAWWGLLIGSVTAMSLVSLLTANGTSAVFENRGTRLLFLAIGLGGMVAYSVMVLVTRRSVAEHEELMDERDRMIMAKAPSVQLVAGFITLIVWVLVLTEVYWKAKAVPIHFLDLILWSTFLVCVLARSVAILVGYRRL